MKNQQIVSVLQNPDLSIVYHFETFEAILSISRWHGEFVLKLRKTVGNRLPTNALDCAKVVLGLEGEAKEVAPDVYRFNT